VSADRPVMHDDERAVPIELVRRLVDTQFPQWRQRPLTEVAEKGTVHAIFRLGDGLAVRLARRRGPTEPDAQQNEWMRQIAKALPLSMPVPVAVGSPVEDYPWYWSVVTWVEGERRAVEEIDALAAARDLVGAVHALWEIPSNGAPRGRGVALVELDASTRRYMDILEAEPEVVAVWEDALAAPVWPGPPRWHHGDLDVRNWLVRGGRICGVIDWDSAGVGDPACDVMVAWKLHSAAARDEFRQAIGCDDDTWRRARGWVLFQSVAALGYYTAENNPELYPEAAAWLELIRSEWS
jgi:aminoglycoside phosphotransferase (APT) family kinase protein